MVPSTRYVALVALRLIVGATLLSASDAHGDRPVVRVEPLGDGTQLMAFMTPEIGRVRLWVPEAIMSDRGASSIYPKGDAWQWDGSAWNQHVGTQRLFGGGNAGLVDERTVECAGVRFPRDGEVSWHTRVQPGPDRVDFTITLTNRGSTTIRKAGAAICALLADADWWSDGRVFVRSTGRWRSLADLGRSAGRDDRFEAWLLDGESFDNVFYRQFWGFNKNRLDRPIMIAERHAPTSTGPAGSREVWSFGITGERAYFLHSNRDNPCADIMLAFGDVPPGETRRAHGTVWTGPGTARDQKPPPGQVDTAPATRPAATTARTYRNPIIDRIGPADPAVIRYQGRYYLYPTLDGKGYDVFISDDLVRWRQKGKCFTDPRGGAWAPDVFHNEPGDGRFYLYYTVDRPGGGKLIGVAVADDALGPFVDRGTLVEQALDAHLFRDDDGSIYLYYSGMAPGHSRIAVQPMADLLTARGDSTVLISPTDEWEKHRAPIAEGPWMLKHKGVYYLMYSGSGADGPDYAVGYATAKSPLGPFSKYAGNPIARRGHGVFGPGHHCVVAGADGRLWMVYHQQDSERPGWRRFLAIDPLWFDEQGTIHVKTTRGTDEPAP
ncbi:MAG: family 43 glycosylhydrolase [Planctomycetes bacterium]|nr:family 43 glycosylhydrolase [Planctomycetota bacterium]